MDAVFLARLQFGLTAGFHFLFPPTTLGLSLIILLLETLYLRTKKDLYKDLSAYLVRILGIVFVMGVATGIVLEFAFGNNWAAYSRTVGDVFGAPLAAEAVFSFFLESVFLGVLVFGRNRVRPKTYRLSVFLVFFGAHLSGLWIIMANSWMQTPAGFHMESGRAVLDDFFRAAFNPSTAVRFVHTILGGWLTGALVAMAIAAWLMLKGRAADKAAALMKMSLAVFAVSAVLQLGTGHAHSVQVTRTQPEKMAAFEALWRTEDGAAFTVFGIPDEKNERTRLAVRIPKMLSLLVHFDPNGRVLGLDEFPKEDRPPVLLPFATYHAMILFGLVFIALAVAGVWLQARKKLGSSRGFLKLLLIAVPLPYLANEGGWIAAEVGRQPWAVYKVLRTSEAVSAVVPAGNVLFSLILFTAIYALIGAAGFAVILRTIRRGPGDETVKARQGAG
ncbi:MAG: cytochrome D ubiquinol oxidase subunit I [Candidatus Aminicenantes bacterium RBG_16_66_30]|nr:MAG: cytochrome D ubiquinol oxidase subunit I [Candidatus Aminicenantes bacterium RBG_16_66_30]